MTIDQSLFEDNNHSTAGYALQSSYDNLMITNTEITGVRPFQLKSGKAMSKYANNVTINGLHNVTCLNSTNPVVTPENYEELVIVSKEINNEYSGVEPVIISLTGDEYIETEPIIFENNTCNCSIFTSSWKYKNY